MAAAPPGGNSSFRRRLLDQHEWIPLLQVGDQLVGEKTLRDTGETHNASGDGLGVGAAKGIASILSGLDPDPPKVVGTASALTATWLEFEMRVPGEAAKTIRRTVFDLHARSQTPASQRPVLSETQRLTRTLALMMDTEILPAVAWFPPEYLAHLQAQYLLANRDLLARFAGATWLRSPLSRTRSAFRRARRPGCSTS